MSIYQKLQSAIDSSTYCGDIYEETWNEMFEDPLYSENSY